MPQIKTISNQYLSQKLAYLSRELFQLSQMLKQKEKVKTEKLIVKEKLPSIEGLFEGMKISDAEIKKAQKEL